MKLVDNQGSINSQTSSKLDHSLVRYLQLIKEKLEFRILSGHFLAFVY